MPEACWSWHPVTASGTTHTFSRQQRGSQQSTEVQPAIDSTVKSAFSGVSLLPEDQTRRLSDSSEQGMPAQWPEVCTWTLPCHVYNYRTVTFNFRDPALPGVLQPAINVSLHDMTSAVFTETVPQIL